MILNTVIGYSLKNLWMTSITSSGRFPHAISTGRVLLSFQKEAASNDQQNEFIELIITSHEFETNTNFVSEGFEIKRHNRKHNYDMEGCENLILGKISDKLKKIQMYEYIEWPNDLIVYNGRLENYYQYPLIIFSFESGEHLFLQLGVPRGISIIPKSIFSIDEYFDYINKESLDEYGEKCQKPLFITEII